MSPIPLFIALALTAQAPEAEPRVEPVAETSRIAPEFLETLEKTQATIAGLKNFSVTARVKSSLTDPNGGADATSSSTSTQSVVISRPNRFVIRCEWAQFGEAEERPALRVASDGKRLVVHYPPAALYAEYEGPDTVQEVYRQHIVESTLEDSGLSVLLRPNLRDYTLQRTRSATVKGQETLDGVAVTRFTVEYVGVPVDMWIGPKDAPLLRRLEAAFETGPPNGPKLLNTRRSDLTWQVDAPVTDSTFAVATPTDARRVDDVYAVVMGGTPAGLVGKPAPILSLTNLEGAVVPLGGSSDRPTVLVFWASWGAEAGETIKQVAALRATLGDRARLLAVSLGDTAQTVKGLIEGVAGLPTILLDPDDTASAAYNIKAVPTTAIVDADGKVVRVDKGLDSRAVVDQLGALAKPSR